MSRVPSLPPKKFGDSDPGASLAPAPISSAPSSASAFSGTTMNRKKVTAVRPNPKPQLSVITSKPKSLASVRPTKRTSLATSTTPRTRPPPAKRSNNAATSSST